MLPLWLSPSLGFGSFNSATAAANPVNCADSPDSVMKDMIGSTCAELKTLGKCDGYQIVASRNLDISRFFSSSQQANVRQHDTTYECFQHSSDTGSGGDCSAGTTGNRWALASPQRCCSHYPGGDFDPMCVFDYCLKKLSPFS